jgi:hypothetical protein
MKTSFVLAVFMLSAASALHADELSGRVVSVDGQPLRAAHVYVYMALPRSGPNKLCPSCYRDCGKHESISADGAFRLRELDPALRFRLLAVASGYEPAFSDYVPGGTPVTITLKPRAVSDAAHVICGTVVDPTGKPVVGAIVEPAGVRVKDEHGGFRIGYGQIPGVDKLSITDADGEFALRLPDDAFASDVRIRARNFAPVIHRMLQPSEPRTLRITPGGAVAGRVVDGEKPVAGALVKVEQVLRYSQDYLGTEEIATDENGRFVLAPVGANDYYVVSVVTGTTVPRELARTIVKVKGELTSADAGTINLSPAPSPRPDNQH